MVVLGVILARAGSKGLPGKCMRQLLGRPVITYTFDHVRTSRRLTACVLTTDCDRVMALARSTDIEVIERPAALVSDTARVDAAARHAVEEWERRHLPAGRIPVTHVVLLYGNIPVRAEGLIDRTIEHLLCTEADSVRTVAPVGKHHPDWLHGLEGDRIRPFRENSIHRRQDLEPLYYHDGAVIAVTREALFDALKAPDDPHAFFGRDRRAVVVRPDDAVDIDEPIDLYLAEAVLRARDERIKSGRDGQALSCGTQDRRIGTIKKVSIGPRAVGPGLPTFIIAEAGVNHGGNVDAALQLVDAAAEAGADAVKFQLFRAADLVTALADTTDYQKAAYGATSQRQMLKRLELASEAFAVIRERCAQRSILFLATPFGEAEVAHLEQWQVGAIKIASTDLPNIRLLDAAAATGLPMILSTGASSGEEIHAAFDRLKKAGATRRLILLHCVSCYPAPMEAINLRAIRTLHKTFNVPCGLSDHSTSTQTGAWAVAAGACVLEKHLTLDCTAGGPDDAMSLDPLQFAEYVRNVRTFEQALGTGDLSFHTCEAEVRAKAGRSIVAAVDIPAGTPIHSDLLALKRPGTGIPPGALEMLTGRRAKKHIAGDTVLSWEMVE